MSSLIVMLGVPNRCSVLRLGGFVAERCWRSARIASRPTISPRRLTYLPSGAYRALRPAASLAASAADQRACTSRILSSSVIASSILTSVTVARRPAPGQWPRCGGASPVRQPPDREQQPHRPPRCAPPAIVRDGHPATGRGIHSATAQN